MLIRWTTPDDKPAWVSLASEVAEMFGHPGMPADPDFHKYMDSKIAKYEALIAVRRMTNECLGIIGFSRTHNRTSWFAALS